MPDWLSICSCLGTTRNTVWIPLLSAPKNHDSQSHRKGSEGEMLYYIQHCRNECHVVVTSVTPGRDITMQGHSQAARPAVLGWWSQVSVPRQAAPKIYIPNHPTGASALNPTGCQPHWGSQCQQAEGLSTSESRKNILGYTSCPLSYPHWNHWRS